MGLQIEKGCNVGSRGVWGGRGFGEAQGLKDGCGCRGLRASSGVPCCWEAVCQKVPSDDQDILGRGPNRKELPKRSHLVIILR